MKLLKPFLRSPLVPSQKHNSVRWEVPEPVLHKAAEVRKDAEQPCLGLQQSKKAEQADKGQQHAREKGKRLEKPGQQPAPLISCPYSVSRHELNWLLRVSFVHLYAIVLLCRKLWGYKSPFWRSNLPLKGKLLAWTELSHNLGCKPRCLELMQGGKKKL